VRLCVCVCVCEDDLDFERGFRKRLRREIKNLFYIGI